MTLSLACLRVNWRKDFNSLKLILSQCANWDSRRPAKLMEKLWDSLMIHLGAEGQYEATKVGGLHGSFPPSWLSVGLVTRPLTVMETTHNLIRRARAWKFIFRWEHIFQTKLKARV